MNQLPKSFVAAVVLFALCGCGIYTFSGSTLPGHLKTVDIPLFLNESLQPDVADLLTAQISQRMLSENLLRIVSNRGDATISGTVTSYSNAPYTYGAVLNRDVTVNKYAVRISVKVTFTDNIRDKELYSGVLTGEGIYDFATENENDGQKRAITKVMDAILQNSVQSW